MFPEDTEIKVSKLIRLWTAEGFVQNNESGTLGEAAEGYLMDLIGRNLVMVSRRRYDGKVKNCQVHDVVLHFCLEMSREEKFMLAAKEYYSEFLLFVSRFSFSHTHNLSLFEKTPMLFLRSLICCGKEIMYWNSFSQICKVKFLKVLDLSSLRVHRFSTDTLRPLILLKYLAVNAKQFDFHPESHLCQLETLVVTGCFLVLLSAIFWKMEKLRHVDIRRAVFDFNYLEVNKQGNFEESLKFENLRILRRLELSIINGYFSLESGDRVKPFSFHDSVDVLTRRCPNIQELSIFIEGRHTSQESSTCIELEGFTQLQLLELTIEDNIIVSEFHLPSYLNKLKLDGFYPLTRRAISMIAVLPCLEYLIIEDSKFEQLEWCLGDIVFDKLKFLKLASLRISRWDDSEESFPQLETLVIKSCSELTEIPLSFADILTLKQIKLIKCKNESLVASAMEIKEEIEANEGSDRLNLIIKDS